MIQLGNFSQSGTLCPKCGNRSVFDGKCEMGPSCSYIAKKPTGEAKPINWPTWFNIKYLPFIVVLICVGYARYLYDVWFVRSHCNCKCK